jgi:topoisomerase IA-like protein
MKQLTLAEIERALSKRRKPKTAKKAHKKTAKKAHKKTAKKAHKKTAKKAHKKTAKKAGPLRGAAKAEFLARMKRGRARARRA